MWKCGINLAVRNSSWEICLSMRKIIVRGRVEIACLGGIFKNHVVNMDCEATQVFSLG